MRAGEEIRNGVEISQPADNRRARRTERRHRKKNSILQPRQFLPELLGAAHRAPLQVELPTLRVLLELFGFLLKTAVSFHLSAISHRSNCARRSVSTATGFGRSIYNESQV